MHGHCGLAGARRSLYDHVVLGLFADDFVLLLLDCGNDLAQHRLFVPRQIFCQQFIVGHHIRIVEVLQLIIFDLISALPRQGDVVFSLPLYGIRDIPQSGIVIYAGNGCSPVDDLRFCRVIRNDTSADIVDLVFFQFFVPEIDSAKVGLFPRLFRPAQILVHELETGICIVPQGLGLLVVLVEFLLHGMQFFRQSLYTLPVGIHLALCDL